jgi:ribosome-associated translation inhibitor RaiA
VEILFQSHHAQVSDRMRERARVAVTKLGARLARAVNAVVRFEEDGPTRRVEIVLHAPRRRAVVAEGTARFFGPALAFAIERLDAQTQKVKRTPKARSRKLARA